MKVHCIPPNFVSPSVHLGDAHDSVGVIGSLAKPNVEGINYFSSELLSARSLVVAGGLSTLDLFADRANGRNLGVVNDVIDFYKEVSVALIPVRFGGGIKIKAVESISYGRPIFSTKHGIDGLPAGIEEFSYVSDQKDDWTWSNFMQLKGANQNHIRQYFNENFSDEACLRKLKNVFQ